MSQISTGIGLANVTLSPRSVETGFSSMPFAFGTTTTTTIWENIDAVGKLYGTVVVIGNIVTGTTRIAINGINTTPLTDGETFSRSSNPLTSIVVAYSGNQTTDTELSVSFSASKFEF